MMTLQQQVEGNVSIQLQKLLSKYDINDRDFIQILKIIGEALDELKFKAIYVSVDDEDSPYYGDTILAVPLSDLKNKLKGDSGE